MENPYQDLELRRELVQDSEGRWHFTYIVYHNGREVARDGNQNKAEKLAVQALGRERWLNNRRY